MKRLILLTLLFSFTLILSAQEKLVVAFQKSYQYENNKQYAEALGALQGYNDPLSYEVQLRLGWLYYLNGNFAKSSEHYSKASDLMPFAIEPLLGLIYPLNALEKWQGVEQTYKEILKRDPNNTKANYYLGLIYYNRKDYATAKKHLVEVVHLFPFDLDSSLLLGWVQLNLENSNEAKKLFNRVLLQDATNVSAKEGLSYCK